jgi:hypothetical protein
MMEKTLEAQFSEVKSGLGESIFVSKDDSHRNFSESMKHLERNCLVPLDQTSAIAHLMNTQELADMLEGKRFYLERMNLNGFYKANVRGELNSDHSRTGDYEKSVQIFADVLYVSLKVSHRDGNGDSEVREGIGFRRSGDSRFTLYAEHYPEISAPIVVGVRPAPILGKGDRR